MLDNTGAESLMAHVGYLIRKTRPKLKHGERVVYKNGKKYIRRSADDVNL